MISLNVREPFSTNGLRLPGPATGNRLDARWELRHHFGQDVATPELVCPAASSAPCAAVDVTDAATGRVITVRSEPRTVTIRF